MLALQILKFAVLQWPVQCNALRLTPALSSWSLLWVWSLGCRSVGASPFLLPGTFLPSRPHSLISASLFSSLGSEGDRVQGKAQCWLVVAGISVGGSFWMWNTHSWHFSHGELLGSFLSRPWHRIVKYGGTSLPAVMSSLILMLPVPSSTSHSALLSAVPSRMWAFSSHLLHFGLTKNNHISCHL